MGRKAISILRAACPEEMAKLAQLCAVGEPEDKDKDKDEEWKQHVRKAFKKMRDHSDEWAALSYTREPTKEKRDAKTAPEAQEDGEKKAPKVQTYYQPWQKRTKEN